MLHSSGHDYELARAKLDRTVPKFNSKASAYPKEKLVFSLVVMPDEGALELDELDFLAVEFPDYLGAPVLGDERKLLGEVDLLHYLCELPR